MRGKGRCDACHGRGVFFPSIPSCSIPGLEDPWIVVERCDSCEKFPDDLSAALRFFRVAGWFPCQSGGEHALADARTQKGVRGHTCTFHILDETQNRVSHKATKITEGQHGSDK